MASDAWPEDIPIWIDGTQKWMTGLTRRTTCDDVIYALLHARGLLETDSTDNYAVFERWRAVERPLQGRTKIVKVWSAWGGEQPNVQLLVQRLDDYFIPPGGATRPRRRHRRSNRQRSRHSPNCRCTSAAAPTGGGRPPHTQQCSRCGKAKAAEQLARHLARQERQLQDLEKRVRDTDRQIAEHEARQHARRVQHEGQDYVQDSYLFHDLDRTSSSSCGQEDSVDSALLAVGEEDLDEYLYLCDDLFNLLQRLEQVRGQEQSLLRELQAETSGDARKEEEEEEGKREVEVEALQVQLTRVVSASVLQQRLELDVAKELRLWEGKAKNRERAVLSLQQELNDCEAREDIPEFAEVQSCPCSSLLSSVEYVIPDEVSYSKQPERILHPTGSEGLDDQPRGRANRRDPNEVLSSKPQVPPRRRSRSRDRPERMKPPMPSPRSRQNVQNKTPLSAKQLSQWDNVSAAEDIQGSGDENKYRSPGTAHAELSGKVDAHLIGGGATEKAMISPGVASQEHSLNDCPNSSLTEVVTHVNCLAFEERKTNNKTHRSAPSLLCPGLSPQDNTQNNSRHYPIPGLGSRPHELSRDDSGMCSSDSSTDSGLLLLDTVLDTAGEVLIGQSGDKRRPVLADPGALLDVSVSYVGGGVPSIQDSNKPRYGHFDSQLDSGSLYPVGDVSGQSSVPGSALHYQHQSSNDVSHCQATIAGNSSLFDGNSFFQSSSQIISPSTEPTSQRPVSPNESSSQYHSSAHQSFSQSHTSVYDSSSQNYSFYHDSSSQRYTSSHESPSQGNTSSHNSQFLNNKPSHKSTSRDSIPFNNPSPFGNSSSSNSSLPDNMSSNVTCSQNNNPSHHPSSQIFSSSNVSSQNNILCSQQGVSSFSSPSADSSPSYHTSSGVPLYPQVDADTCLNHDSSSNRNQSCYETALNARQGDSHCLKDTPLSQTYNENHLPRGLHLNRDIPPSALSLTNNESHMHSGPHFSKDIGLPPALPPTHIESHTHNDSHFSKDLASTLPPTCNENYNIHSGLFVVGEKTFSSPLNEEKTNPATDGSAPPVFSSTCSMLPPQFVDVLRRFSSSSVQPSLPGDVFTGSSPLCNDSDDSSDEQANDCVPVIVTDQHSSTVQPVSIISRGMRKNFSQDPSIANGLPAPRGKTVRFAEEMTSWWWCDGDDDDDSSDDTGLSSMHDEDVLETLV